MDSILVVNAGSSSVKFQVFEIGGSNRLKQLIKGEIALRFAGRKVDTVTL